MKQSDVSKTPSSPTPSPSNAVQQQSAIPSLGMMAMNPMNIMQLQRTIGNQAALQLFHSQSAARPVAQRAEQPDEGNKTGMPDNLKSGLESMSGFDLSNVRVHYNSDEPAKLQAHAYAQGNDIHLGPGQEKHLPHEGWHVVQQRQGRVQPTKQLKEAAINDDSALEKEADVMGGKAFDAGIRGEPGVERLGKKAAPSSPVLQGAFGMEKESKIPVELEDEVIEGYPTIGQHSMFKVDIDKSKGKSILEVVIKHFNEHEGTTEQAIAELDKRLKAAWAFLLEAQSSGKNTPLKSVADKHSVALTGEFQNIQIAGAGTMEGPVHYTVGFSLDKIPALLQELSDKTTSASIGTVAARKRGNEANQIGQALNQSASPKVAGFMQLLYTQIAALIDNVKDKSKDAPLVKNRLFALARVSMGAMRRSLSDTDQQYLKDNYKTILAQMRLKFSGKADKWGDHKKDKVLVHAAVNTMTKAAFGLDGIKDNDPSASNGGFGKMTVVPGSEDVGDPLNPDKGFALELRKIPVENVTDLNSILESSIYLIQLSRALHGTPEPKAIKEDKNEDHAASTRSDDQSTVENADGKDLQTV